MNEEEFVILVQATMTVELEDMRQTALRMLTNEQLQWLIWIGLTADGWRAVVEERGRRDVE